MKTLSVRRPKLLKLVAFWGSIFRVGPIFGCDLLQVNVWKNPAGWHWATQTRISVGTGC